MDNLTDEERREAIRKLDQLWSLICSIGMNKKGYGNIFIQSRIWVKMEDEALDRIREIKNLIKLK
jgi:hypothetical protein